MIPRQQGRPGTPWGWQGSPSFLPFPLPPAPTRAGSHGILPLAGDDLRGWVPLGGPRGVWSWISTVGLREERGGRKAPHKSQERCLKVPRTRGCRAPPHPAAPDLTTKFDPVLRARGREHLRDHPLPWQLRVQAGAAGSRVEDKDRGGLCSVVTSRVPVPGDPTEP